MNVKFIICYDGTRYFGWQKQPSKPTIQQVIEDSLCVILNKKDIRVIGSGRTDKGVHALGQTANVIIDNKKLSDNFLYKLNKLLPDDIRILSAVKVNNEFNSRFETKKREYRYYIWYNKDNSPFFNKYCYRYSYNIKFKLINKCMPFFLGKKDFSIFSNSSKEINPIRVVYKFNYKRKKDYIMFKIVAQSFLQGMVRNIIGTILDVNKYD